MLVADLLARGSLSPATFPGMRVSQWQIGRRLTAYSCGGSRGIGRLVAHAPRSLLIPTGTTVAILSRYGARGQVNATARHQMSAFGTKRTFRRPQPMSAFGGKADITGPALMSAFDPKRTLTCKSLKPSGPMTARWPQLLPPTREARGAKKLLWNNANQFTRTALMFLRTDTFS